MNTWGRLFRVTTWGESHGPATGAVIDGCPAGLRITPEDIQKELDRRRPGQSSVTTQRSESDTAQILSGIFETRRSERRSPLSYKTKMLVRVHTMSCVMCRAQDMPVTRFKLSMDGEITEVAAELQRVRRRHALLQEL